MGFDLKATRAWWDFFHRFSLVYSGSNFDYIVLLGLNLLQCGECQEDGIQFYKTIGSHKSPFEKIHILHNYVNRKLHKPIFELDDTRKYSSDILLANSQKPNWLFLSRYYFSLLFAMTRYLEEDRLQDLKEFSAYIYQSFNTTKQLTSLVINTTHTEFNRETLKLQIYEYYQKFNTSLSFSKHGNQSYRDIYGQTPTKPKYCKSCAKKHQLYLESHNKAKLNTPSNEDKLKREEYNVNREIIKEQTKVVGLQTKNNQSNINQSNINQSNINQMKNNQMNLLKNDLSKNNLSILSNNNLSNLTSTKDIKQIPKPPSPTKILLERQQINLAPPKKPRDRKEYIVDQRIAGKPIELPQPQKFKYKPIPKTKSNITLNQPQVNIRINKIDGKTIRKKVIPVDNTEMQQKRLITFKRSRIIRYKQQQKKIAIK